MSTMPKILGVMRSVCLSFILSRCLAVLLLCGDTVAVGREGAERRRGRNALIASLSSCSSCGCTACSSTIIGMPSTLIYDVSLPHARAAPYPLTLRHSKIRMRTKTSYRASSRS